MLEKQIEAKVCDYAKERGLLCEACMREISDSSNSMKSRTQLR